MRKDEYSVQNNLIPSIVLYPAKAAFKPRGFPHYRTKHTIIACGDLYFPSLPNSNVFHHPVSSGGTVSRYIYSSHSSYCRGHRIIQKLLTLYCHNSSIRILWKIACSDHFFSSSAVLGITWALYLEITTTELDSQLYLSVCPSIPSHPIPFIHPSILPSTHPSSYLPIYIHRQDLAKLPRVASNLQISASAS